MTNFSEVWISTLRQTLQHGKRVSPRGRQTLERLHVTTQVSMKYPVLQVTERKLSYQFMAAEAYWILSGDDRVEMIAPYNQHITKFSDDGERFFGAYGPKIVAQLPYVIAKLREDPLSRQAGLTIWRESPPATKDVPCTIAIFFSLRDGDLDAHVFMRSSDIWLGLPYDVFTFSMLTHLVCGYLNSGLGADRTVRPGQLYLTAASSHLYEDDMMTISRVLLNGISGPIYEKPVPSFMFLNPDELLSNLKHIKDTKKGDALRWWE